MEDNKNKKGSSSSFTSDLFGSKEKNSASATTSIFQSIFPRPNTALGREALQAEQYGRKQYYANQGTYSRTGEGYSDSNDSYYQEQRVQQPCHLSSSIYYGGQDVYSHPQTTQPRMINRDEGEDDTGSASRGNWWKGSLYY